MSIFKKKEKKVEYDSKKYSTSASELYGEAANLGEIIENKMKKVDKSLTEGITIIQYDMFMRLAMYLIRIEIFDSSKFNSKQIQILQEVWKLMALPSHSFFLMTKFNTKEIYNRTLQEVEDIYLEKINFCEYMFMKSPNKSLMDYLETPSSILYFDYVEKDYLDMNKITEKFKSLINHEPDNIYINIKSCIIDAFTEYKEKFQNIDNITNDILKRFNC